MKKTMFLAIGGAGRNLAKTMKNKTTKASIRQAAYLFADTENSAILDLQTEGLNTLPLSSDFEKIPSTCFNGVDTLYLVAGLGGNTGSKGVPMAIKAAQKAGVSKINAIVTLPFSFEGIRVPQAQAALAEINTLLGHTVKVIHNDKYKKLKWKEAFEKPLMDALKAVESDVI